MKNTKKNRFIIIDGNAIIHRAYHALPPMSAHDGTVTNAVFGFTSMLLKVIENLKPTHLAVSFDVAGKTFRDDLYEDYKATRVKADQDLYDQIPLVHEMVKAFNIPIFTKEGFEADDVIGTIAKQITKKHCEDTEVIVVTGDKDLLQLVDDCVNVYLLRKGMSDVHMVDIKGVKDIFSFGPEQVVTYKSLKGDPSDNIPGVAGVGDKTAKLLIEKIGGLSDIYKAVEDENSILYKDFKPRVIKLLKEDKDAALMSEKLATIETKVPGVSFSLKKAEVNDYDPQVVIGMLRKFEFYSLVKRLPGVEVEEETEKKVKKEKIKVEILENKDISGFLKKISSEKEFGVKIIEDSKDVFTANVLGFIFWVLKKPYYLDFARLSEENREKIYNIFEEKNYTLVGHDVKQLVKILLHNKKQINNKLFDIMVASYVVNASTRAHDLKATILRELGEELPEKSSQGNLFGIDPSMGAIELNFVMQLYKKYKKELDNQENAGLFDDIEMSLIPVLAKMELHGVSLDTEFLEKYSKEVHKKIEILVKKIWKEAGEEFNVASSTQLREILFNKMGLPTEGIKKGKTGYSTAASELEKLREVHEIIPLIEEHRELSKLQNTYIDSLPKLVNKKTNRLHTSFNQTVAATGRLSSSDPNLQNIPIRTPMGRKIRDAFVAEKGYSLIAADYSQFELRVVASLAEDKQLMDIFKKGEDIHKATAAAIHDVPIEKVTKDQRRSAKEVNFGVLYGMGAYGLSARTGLPQWQAREFIEKYFEAFSGVKKFIDETIEFAKEEGYVETFFGRRRYIPEIQAGNFQIRASGERMAVNMPVQGTQADLMKLAMIDVQKFIDENFKNDEVRLLLQVHDELVLEVKTGMEDKIVKKVKEIMENVTKLRVPIEVHAGVGKNWGEIK